MGNLKNQVKIETSYQKSMSETITHNLKLFYESKHDKFFHIAMDEIKLVERVRWDPIKNEIVGTCYNHKYRQTSYEFKNIVN